MQMGKPIENFACMRLCIYAKPFRLPPSDFEDYMVFGI